MYLSTQPKKFSVANACSVTFTFFPSFLSGKILIRQSELMDRGAKYVLVGGRFVAQWLLLRLSWVAHFLKRLVRVICSQNIFLRGCIDTKHVNSNLGCETSLSGYVPLLPWLSASRAAWLVLTQQKHEMGSLNLNFSRQVWLKQKWTRKLLD